MEKYTEKNMLAVINRNFLSSPRWIINNLYVYDWESDYLAITRSMYAYEIEVKVSISDFHNDFKHKMDKHKVMAGMMEGNRISAGDSVSNKAFGRPNYFYYAVPEGMISVEDVPPYSGLIYVKGNRMRTVKGAPVLHREKFDPLAYEMMDKFYYNWRSAKEKFDKLGTKDLRDEMRKKLASAKGKIVAGERVRAIQAFRDTCEAAYWPYGGKEAGLAPSCSLLGGGCEMRCERGIIFKMLLNNK